MVTSLFSFDPEKGHPFPALDGIRALFIFWVMFYHLPPQSLSPWFAALPGKISFGVDGFLALSGFLVTRSLFSHLAKNESIFSAIKTFLVKRISRIWPPYLLMLVLIAFLALATHNQFLEQLFQYPSVLKSLPLFYANYTLPKAGWEVPLILQTYWSVSFQEQFYVLIALLAFLSKARFKIAVWVLVLFSIVARLILVTTVWKDNTHFFHLESYLHLNFDAMAFGSLAWMYFDSFSPLFKSKGRIASFVCLTLCLLLVSIGGRYFWHNDFSHSVLSPLKSFSLALLMRILAEPRLLNSVGVRFLSLKIFRAIGSVSYEAFLIHTLIYMLLLKTGIENESWFFVVGFSLALVFGKILNLVFSQPIQKKLVARFSQ